MQAAGENLDVTSKQIVQIFRILYYLVGKIIEDSIDSEQVFDNQQQLTEFLGDEGSSQRLVDLVSGLEENRSELEKANFDARRLTGVMPLFSQCRGTVDARVSWDDSGTGISDLVPVASVVIELDSGSPSSFSFQADLAGVQEMISLMNQLKERMEKTRDYFLSKK